MAGVAVRVSNIDYILLPRLDIPYQTTSQLYRHEQAPQDVRHLFTSYDTREIKKLPAYV